MSLHRSVSEGMMHRGGNYQSSYHNQGSEGLVQTSGPNSHSREGGSAGGLQEEVNYNPRMPGGGAADREAPQPGPRTSETPDFAMIYAFLGSMFDPVPSPPPSLPLPPTMYNAKPICGLGLPRLVLLCCST